MSEYETTHDAPSDYLSGVHTPLDPGPAPDTEPFGSNHTEIERAAEELSSSREGRNQVIERAFHDGVDISKAAPGNRSVSAEYAADSLKALRDDEAALAQAEIDAATAKAVNDLRGEQPAQPTEQPQQPELAPQAEVPPAEPTELDRMLAELPEHRRAPFVAAFTEHMDRAAYQARAAYDQAVQQAQAVTLQNEQAAAQALFRGEALLPSQAPELAQVTREQRLLALDILEKQNPARAAQIRALDRQIGMHLQTEAYNLRAAQEQRQQTYAQERAAYEQNFKRWADTQDDLLEKTSWANESPQNRNAIAREIVDHYRQYGVSEQDLIDNYNKNPAMRHAATQALIADGIRYRQAQRNIPRAVARPIPQVQRPGVASEESRDYSEYSHLERQHRGQSLTPKQAAELVIAKRARR